MASTLKLLIGATILLFLWIMVTYNSIIRIRNSVKQSWAGIDVQLTRRAQLIPNLVETVKGYMKHERKVLEEITKARSMLTQAQSKGETKRAAATNDEMSGLFKNLFAVAENYPQLKANTNFLHLQKELTKTEDNVAAARRIYNENVTYHNNTIQVFPKNIIANMFNFNALDVFEASPADREAVNVELHKN